MPNRILREGIITSRRMAELENLAGWFGEVFYRRLMSKVDDYGRYTADPALLRPELFPRQLEKVREPDMSRLLAACEKAGLITLYTLSGEVYLEMRDFRQQTRAKASKYPPPTASDDHMRSTCVADAQHVRAYTETDTDTETNTGAASGVGSRASPRRKEEMPEIPVGLSNEQFLHWWGEWLAYRRERKQAIKPRSAKLQLAELEKMGVSAAIESIRRSITNGWQGIFPVNGQSRDEPPAPAMNRRHCT